MEQYHNEALRKARVLERKLAAQSGMSGQNTNQSYQVVLYVILSMHNTYL